MWDARGRRYLDGVSSLWNVAIGHGNARIARAVARQIRKLSYATTLLGFSSEPAVELARELVRLAPRGLSRVVFTSGGSEANETAVRLVRMHWRLRGRNSKTGIVTLERAYHGSTTGAATLTGLRDFHRGFGPMLPGVFRIPNAYCYRCPLGKTYPRCGVACADELDRAVRRMGADRVGAFFAEPVQGVGGVIVPPPEYFPKIREICDRHELLFVADEVITAFGRLGYPFGIQRWGVTPDLLVFAKGVTSGYLPLGGVLLHERVARVFEEAGPDFTLHHGFTYSGHPVVCAGALANLEVLRRKRLFRKARSTEKTLRALLRPLGELPLVGDIRVVGAMAAIELVRDRSRKTPFPEETRVAWRVRERALAHGVIVRGSRDNVILCPPLDLSARLLRTLVSAVDRSIREVGREFGYRL